MKKLSISLLLIAALAANTYAADKISKKHDVKEVGYNVSDQFAGSFANAKNVVWTITDRLQKADFILNDKKMTAFYNLGGDFMGVSQNVNFSLVPIEAQDEITKQYAGYKIGDVIEYETPANNENLQKLGDQEDSAIKFFVDLKNDQEEILLKVNRSGFVSFFKQIK